MGDLEPRSPEVLLKPSPLSLSCRKILKTKFLAQLGGTCDKMYFEQSAFALQEEEGGNLFDHLLCIRHCYVLANKSFKVSHLILVAT